MQCGTEIEAIIHITINFIVKGLEIFILYALNDIHRDIEELIIKLGP